MKKIHRKSFRFPGTTLFILSFDSKSLGDGHFSEPCYSSNLILVATMSS